MQLLPLAIIHQHKIYRNHILSYNFNDIAIYPFERECESTRFISNVVIIANLYIRDHLNSIPQIGECYINFNDVMNYLQKHNIYLNNGEEPTLISASPSGYEIINFDY